MGHGGRASRRKGNRTERAGPGLAWARARLSTPRGETHQRTTRVLRQQCQANAMPDAR